LRFESLSGNQSILQKHRIAAAASIACKPAELRQRLVKGYAKNVLIAALESRALHVGVISHSLIACPNSDWAVDDVVAPSWQPQSYIASKI
jgi:hypothetical protein